MQYGDRWEISRVENRITGESGEPVIRHHGLQQSIPTSLDSHSFSTFTSWIVAFCASRSNSRYKQTNRHDGSYSALSARLTVIKTAQPSRLCNSQTRMRDFSLTFNNCKAKFVFNKKNYPYFPFHKLLKFSTLKFFSHCTTDTTKTKNEIISFLFKLNAAESNLNWSLQRFIQSRKVCSM